MERYCHIFFTILLHNIFGVSHGKSSYTFSQYILISVRGKERGPVAAKFRSSTHHAMAFKSSTSNG